MKQVVCEENKQVKLIDVPDPKAGGEFVVVKILATPMCTEYKGYKAGNAMGGLGHESAGEVVEVAQPGTVKVGDRVVIMPQYPCGKCSLCLGGDYIHCRNCRNALEETGSEAGTATYAQYQLKQDWLCLPIPEGVSIEHGSMACCGFGPAFGAMQRMQVDALDTVMVTGMGPVGLGAVVNAVYRGAQVIAVEGQPFRAKLAGDLGAALVVDPADENALEKIIDFTDGRGVDKSVDCSGAAQAQRLLIDAARRRGQVSFVGEAGDLTIRVSNDMIRKGLSLHGVWHWNLADTARMMKTIAENGPQIDKMITHTFPMSKVQEAWELQVTGNCGKVILQPWG
jgi:L-iditol 2-dehydrogenase